PRRRPAAPPGHGLEIRGDSPRAGRRRASGDFRGGPDPNPRVGRIAEEARATAGTSGRARAPIAHQLPFLPDGHRDRTAARGECLAPGPRPVRGLVRKTLTAAPGAFRFRERRRNSLAYADRFGGSRRSHGGAIMAIVEHAAP